MALKNNVQLMDIMSNSNKKLVMLCEKIRAHACFIRRTIMHYHNDVNVIMGKTLQNL
jgi:hypothetical protein